MRSRAAIAAVLFLGCSDPVTEVLIVVPSDVALDISAQGTVLVAAGERMPVGTDGFGGPLSRLPMTVSVVSGGSTGSFSAVLVIRQSPPQGERIAIQRTVHGVRFESQQTRILLVPLVLACACHDTQCPPPGTPGCEDLTNPPLIPFDPLLASDNATALAAQDGGGVTQDASASAD